MVEAALAAARVPELFDDLELHLLERYEYHLRNPFARLNFIGLLAAIPAGSVHLSLVIGIDQSGQVSEDKPVFVAKP